MNDRGRLENRRPLSQPSWWSARDRRPALVSPSRHTSDFMAWFSLNPSVCLLKVIPEGIAIIVTTDYPLVANRLPLLYVLWIRGALQLLALRIATCREFRDFGSMNLGFHPLASRKTHGCKTKKIFILTYQSLMRSVLYSLSSATTNSSEKKDLV